MREFVLLTLVLAAGDRGAGGAAGSVVEARLALD
jgi:hypothetical protein